MFTNTGTSPLLAAGHARLAKGKPSFGCDAGQKQERLPMYLSCVRREVCCGFCYLCVGKLLTNCRHVVLPTEISQHLPKDRLLSEVGNSIQNISHLRVESVVLIVQPRHSCENPNCIYLPCMSYELTLSKSRRQYVFSLGRQYIFGLLQIEWRNLGVQQSRGWVHYAIHRPEIHIMLFRWAPELSYDSSSPLSWVKEYNLKPIWKYLHRK